MNPRSKILIMLLIIILDIYPSEGLKEISNNEILDKIANGDSVEYDGCLIKGDLDIGQSLENATVSSQININNSIFDGDVNLRDVTFLKQVSFKYTKFIRSFDAKGSKFLNEANFQSTDFPKNASFNKAMFASPAHFQKSHFDNITFDDALFASSAYFQESHFDGLAQIRDVNFLGDANFRNSVFNRTTFFQGTSFHGDTGFKDCEFHGDAKFKNSRFKGDACFEGAQFDKIAVFSVSDFNGTAEFPRSKFGAQSLWTECRFNGDTNFDDANLNIAYFDKIRFLGKVDFRSATLNDDAVFKSNLFNKSADFSGSTFNRNVDFEDSKFKDNAVFNLVGFKGSSTSFNRTQFNGDLFFEGAKFGGILYLTKFKYNKIYIRWIDINNKLNFDDAAYISLMESFKKAGLLEDADNCYYQYRRERRNQPWIITTQTGMIGMLEEPFRKNIDRLLEEFYAYGVDPLRPIYYSMILIIIFTFVWRFLGFGLCKGADKPCRKAKSIREYVEEMRDQLYTMKDPLCFSFLAFLSGTKFIIDPVDLPEQYKELHSARYAFFAEKTLGALFLALLFLSLSRSIIRGS